MDDFRILRERQSAPDAPIGERPQSGNWFVGQVYDGGSIPTTVPKYFLTRPARPGGTESEGSSTSFDVDADASIPVLVIGPRAPVAGDRLVAHAIDGRWVARFGKQDSGGTFPSPNCPCNPTPQVMLFTGSTGCSSIDFPNATLRWQDTPPEWVAIGYPSKVVLSDETFVDPDRNEEYRYYFLCEPGAYTLRRIYPVSIFGSPFLDVVRASWPFSKPGNSCSPFFLGGGTVFDSPSLECGMTVEAAP